MRIVIIYLSLGLIAVFLFVYSGYQILSPSVRRLAISLLPMNTEMQPSLKLANLLVLLNPWDNEAHLTRAAANFAANYPDRAIADCSAILSNEPHDYGALCLRGLIMIGDDGSGAQSSLADFNEAVKYSPKEYWPFICRAIARFDTGDQGGANQDVQMAVQCNPHSDSACGTLGDELSLFGFTEQSNLFHKRLLEGEARRFSNLSTMTEGKGIPTASGDDLSTNEILSTVAVKRLAFVAARLAAVQEGQHKAQLEQDMLQQQQEADRQQQQHDETMKEQKERFEREVKQSVEQSQANFEQRQKWLNQRQAESEQRQQQFQQALEQWQQKQKEQQY